MSDDIFGDPWNVPTAAQIQIGNITENIVQAIPESIDNLDVLEPLNIPEIEKLATDGYSNDSVQFTSNAIITNNHIITTTPKYEANFIDLYWLFNNSVINSFRYNTKHNIHPNHAHGITISYNVTYGNLRIVFYNIKPSAIQNHIIFKNNLEQITKVTIYPSTACKMLSHDHNTILNINKLTTGIEQLIDKTNDSWINDLNQINYSTILPETDEGFKQIDLINNGWTKESIDKHLEYNILNNLYMNKLFVTSQKNEPITYYNFKENWQQLAFNKALTICAYEGYSLRGKNK